MNCCAPRIYVGPPGGEMSLDHRGPVQAHHAGRKPGTALKADDSTCIPLCDAHHRQWHDANGVFKGWTKAERRMWADAAIADVQGILGRARLVRRA